MAITFQTDSGILAIPGAYPQLTVVSNPSAIGTNGVLMLVGEANEGLAFSEETELHLNAFGPDQVAEVTSKYGSGPLVDAFRGAVTAANDPNIVGQFSRAVLVKTNVATKATNVLDAIGGGDYSSITAKLGGKSGNLISFTVTADTTEVVPSTGDTVVAVPQINTDIEIRVDGGTAISVSLTAGDLPPVIQAAIDGGDVTATGGVDGTLVTVIAGNFQMTSDTGFECHLEIDTAWDTNPNVGDIVFIKTGSPFAADNEGTYVCTAATNTRLDLIKVLDATGSGDDLTPPITEGPLVVAATTDVRAYSPIVISNTAGAVLAGTGKSLEIADTSTGSFADIAFTFDSGSVTIDNAGWVSVTGSPTLLTSDAEYAVNVNVARQSTSTSDDIVTGGDVVLTLGYKGTTATAVIADGVMTITRSGGTGTDLTINLSDYPTIADLVSFISIQTDYVVAAYSTAASQLPSIRLDEGTYNLATAWGAKTGRIKQDGYNFMVDVNAGNVLADVAPIDPATVLVGLPDVSSLAFLSSGAKGATSNSDINLALVALESVRGNFLIPLFSRDASEDIADGLTDAASSYTIASVHSLCRSHVLQMSALKRRKPRQAFVSFRGDFDDAISAASNLASARVSCHFQDCKDTNSLGSIIQFQPWMTAIKAAGTQAAGFYRAIVAKFITASGILQAAGDFNDQNDTQVEDALFGGLNVVTRNDTGGFKFVSDQTTYTLDDNFVFNSIQAVYVGDVIATTLGTRMERAFLGQSVADISAALALTTLEAILGDIKRLKLIAASDDAPKGFKNAKVRIIGPSMIVSVEVKLAGCIYFIPIQILVSPVSQSAG